MNSSAKHKKSLAICMIVKNEQENLEKTLPNNIRFADRTILVDTGSADNTVKIAEGLGAEIYHFSWNNSFSDARNFSISKAKEDWILWLDADEYIDEPSFKAMRVFLDDTEATFVRVSINECRYGETNSGPSYFREKIFKNNVGANFVKPVNEQLVFPKDIKVSCADLPGARICHWGNNLPVEALDKKTRVRIELLEKTAAENKEDFGVRYLLGVKYSEIKLPAKAMDWYSQVVSICEKDPSNSSLKKHFVHAARAKKSKILLELGRNEEALSEALSAIGILPYFLEPCGYAVTALLELKRYEEALALTEQMLKLPKVQHPVLLFDEQEFDYLVTLLHIRCLLLTKGKEAVISFAENRLKDHPDHAAIRQLLEKVKRLP